MGVTKCGWEGATRCHRPAPMPSNMVMRQFKRNKPLDAKTAAITAQTLAPKGPPGKPRIKGRRQPKTPAQPRNEEPYICTHILVRPQPGTKTGITPTRPGSRTRILKQQQVPWGVVADKKKHSLTHLESIVVKPHSAQCILLLLLQKKGPLSAPRPLRSDARPACTARQPYRGNASANPFEATKPL